MNIKYTNANNENFFAFIESNTSGSGRLFLQQAIQKCFKVLFLTSSSQRYPFLQEELVQPIIINTNNKDLILSYLSNINGLQGVYSSSEYYIETAAYIAEKLGLIGNSSNAIINCRNKNILANILKSNNLPTPKTFVIETLDSTQRILKHLAFPVVVKPALGTGSIGVKLCFEQNDLLDHIKSLLSQNINERGQKNSVNILVQEYIEGDEYSVETVGLGNAFFIAGITKKYLGKQPFFVEIGHDYPAALSKDLEALIYKTVTTALNAVNLPYGPTHTELRIKKGIPYIIEINPRLAGGMIPTLVKAASNIDLIDITLDIYSGKNTRIIAEHNYFSSIRFFIPPEEGLLSSIEIGCDKEHKDIYELGFLKKTGDILSLQGDFRDRVGYIITRSDDPLKSITLANQIIDNTKILLNYSNNNLTMSIDDTGRLKHTLHPIAQKIISQQAMRDDWQIEHELAYLCAIDEAHIIMLYEKHIIPLNKTKMLLSAIKIKK